MASFNEWLTDQGLASVDDGTSQNYFSKYYTQWLDSEVVGNEEVASFISQQLDGDMLLAFESGAFKVVMNQNSTDGAPFLDFGDELGLFSLDSIFTGDQDDTHSFTLLSGDDKFEIVGNELILKEGVNFKAGDEAFEIAIKVTDSEGNEYYENFGFQFGSSGNSNDSLNGGELDGDGTVLDDPIIGDDLIFGFRGQDEINGGSGDDILIGGQGNDVITGGAGNDTLFGGGGADQFNWNTGDQGTVDAPAIDYVMDFNGDEDSINIADLLGTEGAYLFSESDGTASLQISSNGSDVDQVIVFNGFNQEALEAVLIQGDNLIT